MFRRFVKTAQWRGRLSAPCLYGDFYSARRTLTGASRQAPRHAGAGGTGGMLRKGLFLHSDVTL